ncbi:MAG: hypothetical protein INQ03_01210 [Candidatus Heimdallarchaeota archaeon]|nr:hypothetical protein [Candidatus Heimdallarchaeota archaeon]
MLRHITIISNDGITIYHKSYVKDDGLDDVLFSALSGAIIAFSKELGDELNSIIMKKQMIYFKPLTDNIIIFSFDSNSGIDQKELERKLNIAVQSNTIKTICSLGISQAINKQLDMELIKLFDLDSEEHYEHEAETVVEAMSIEELTGDAFLDALSKLDNI